MTRFPIPRGARAGGRASRRGTTSAPGGGAPAGRARGTPGHDRAGPGRPRRDAHEGGSARGEAPAGGGPARHRARHHGVVRRSLVVPRRVGDGACRTALSGPPTRGAAAAAAGRRGDHGGNGGRSAGGVRRGACRRALRRQITEERCRTAPRRPWLGPCTENRVPRGELSPRRHPPRRGTADGRRRLPDPLARPRESGHRPRARDAGVARGPRRRDRGARRTGADRRKVGRRQDRAGGRSVRRSGGVGCADPRRAPLSSGRDPAPLVRSARRHEMAR